MEYVKIVDKNNLDQPSFIDKLNNLEWLSKKLSNDTKFAEEPLLPPPNEIDYVLASFYFCLYDYLYVCK